MNDQDEDAPSAAHGLSPLALGMLLGMLMLAGIAGWLVLQSRLDNLETQARQLDERLQVVVGDVRRQGDALREYLSIPGPDRDAAGVRKRADGSDPTPALAALEERLTAQRETIRALEQRLENQQAKLATLERPGDRPGALPAETGRSPKPPPEPVSTPRPPPAGHVVVLASLPQRDQALQELDTLRAKGLDDAVLREARIDDATWYRLQVEGFPDRDTAMAFALRARERHGISGAWVAAP
ncbi:MAG: SPOR domain-containing protein [Gammaproteobacteria bacterium]|nr:SPOR domain-containing protein [Gammaproteobacteria bacterium]